MTPRARLFVLLVLLSALLAACTLDGDEPAVRATTPARSATPRPVDTAADVSIDGRLLFVQQGNLYLHQGTTTRQITADGATRSPQWAPDGSRIAYVRRDESYADIYMLGAEGGVPTQVTFNGSQLQPRTQDFVHSVVWAAEPSWTPDGSQLVFLSQIAPPQYQPLLEYPLSIYKYDLKLVGTRQPTNDDLLVQINNADLQRPAVSADGRTLAFVMVPRDGTPKQIMLYDLDTGTSNPYPGVPANSYDPVWSPDGRWLAFAANVEGRTDVWVVPSPDRGGTPVRLTERGSARSPAWSPDGTKLAFIELGATGNNIMVMTLGGDGETIAPGATEPLTRDGLVDAASGLSWGR